VTAVDLETVTAGKEDANARMVGDVNFFLYPDDEGEGEGEGTATDEDGKELLIGEVDVMIASKDDRRNGSGEGAVRALLLYLQRHIFGVLSEYSSVNGKNVRLKSLMAKIKESNAGSRALFEKLGFKQQGEVNYFGEVKLVTDWIDGIEALDLAWAAAASDYTEVGYSSLAGQLT
jgi:methionyl-tRNA synthetase